ncbi:hypothetical protein ATANTOWER_019430 [Ataeniobius toweri]|uniref:Uncharacterized protein n=1 Tax=Ataeniobius toweri TaxID=208326 RepID=A0ABU7B110_9TELE|nr:hypothetical protein [Ataeniobius toweri]
MFHSHSKYNNIFLVKEFLVFLHSIITLYSTTIPHVALRLRVAQKNGSSYFSLACLTPPSACILGWAGVFSSHPDLHGFYKHSQRNPPSTSETPLVRIRERLTLTNHLGQESGEYCEW